MKRVSLVMLSLVTSSVGCQATLTPPSVQVPGVAVTGGAPAASGGPACTGDAQCVQPDEVLACDTTWVCRLAHTITPPSPQTKGQGQYMLINSGQTLWTDRWIQSRPVNPGETLQIGERIVFPNLIDENTVARPPESSDEANQALWMTARVTDLSNLFKSQVTTSQNARNASLAAVRVITASGTDKVETDN